MIGEWQAQGTMVVLPLANSGAILLDEAGRMITKAEDDKFPGKVTLSTHGDLAVVGPRAVLPVV